MDGRRELESLGNEDSLQARSKETIDKPFKNMNLNLQKTIYMLSKYFLYGFVLQMFFLTFVLASVANGQYKSIEDVIVKIDKSELTLKDFFNEIESQTSFNFLYDSKQINRSAIILLKNRKGSVESFLKEISPQTGLNFRQVNNGIDTKRSKNVEEVITSEFVILVKGQVKDPSGMPLPGTTVQVEGSTTGVVTDGEGFFEISVQDQNAILVFSFIGFETQRVEVGEQQVINVTLNADYSSLEEVVIVGFGTQRKESVTGSISSVDTKALLQSPVANVSNALVGRMPGLLAVQGSGEPGNDQSTLRIRGIGTFSGSADPLILVDGIQVNNYNNIDPNEIENITILKDASSTAVYGVRGANGVLLITTKRGTIGKPQLSITSNVGIQTFTNLGDPMNSYDYARSFNQAMANDSYISGGYTPKFSDEAIEMYRTGEDPLFFPNTNWYDELFKKNSLQTQHNLNLSGGTEKVKYFVSVGYFTQEGLFNNTAKIEEFDANRIFKRYNFRSNFNFEVTKNLSLKVDISSQTEDSKGSNNSTTRIIESAFRANPVNSPGIIDNRVVNLIGQGAVTNPIGLLFSEGYNRRFRNYLQGSVRLDYDLGSITEGLSVHGIVNYQNNNVETLVNRRNDGFVTYNAIQLPEGGVNFVPQGIDSPFGFSQQIDKNTRTYAELGIEYNRVFGKHYVTGLVNYNQTKLFDPSLAFLVPNGFQGIVGRATYEFDDRYLAEFTFGYNGTENFAEGKRFGFFPAVSLGWVVSEEAFFPENNWVTSLKFRGSYGEVGNDRIGDFSDPNSRFLFRPSAYTIGSNGYYFGEVAGNYTGQPYAIEGRLGNPNLTWERAIKKNIGINVALWKDKVNITADVFQENRDNILASLNTVPIIVGATLPAYNFGEMSNKGFDGDISFNDKIGNVGYFVRANYTFAKNKIEFQDEVDRPYSYQMRTGQRLGQIFGLVDEGLYNSWEEVNDANRPISQWNSNKIQPGDIKYKDINGDGVVDFNDEVPIGYSNFPEEIFGISLGANYKGFDFSVLFQGASNVSFQYSRRQNRGFFENSGALNYLLESWTPERVELGLPINFPRLTEDGQLYNHSYQSSTYWVEDGSYVRLKNAEIGYSLSEQALNALRITSARFYINGNNLITWSKLLPGIDPENTPLAANNMPYPLTRTINMGVNIKF